MSDTEVQALNNGPYLIRGDNLCIQDAKGNEYDLKGRDKVFLCRCGHSDNKPFCDGTHKETGFESKPEAFELDPPAS